MRWTQRRASLYGEIEESDRLTDLGHKACPTCDSAFDFVSLGLQRLRYADSEDLKALAAYCQNVSARGGQVSIHTCRPALRRLMLASPLSDFVAAKGDDEPGEGEPFTCPHR
ncbi:MAG: hypothetical protein AAF962_17775 [Actinomycetota bacterium]